ncbi:MAG: DUF6127 family protein [Rhodovibrio sp.]|nr:DUF6127 family protein [Rhodovibrio sp.]
MPEGSRDRADVRDVVISNHQMYVLLEDAAHKGARQALAELGLENGEARRDIDDLRGLANSLRTIRSTAFTTATKVLTLGVIGLLLAGLAVKTNLTKILKPFAGQ